MRVVDIIRKKRDGQSLDPEEIAYLVDGFAWDEIPPYQMSAFLMAVFFTGMSEEETFALTTEMLHSGTVLDFDDLPAAAVDKHSTGGVGDKTSLIVAPAAAAGGALVPMISGRGLGHTGGTLDKLESIPGFQVVLPPTRFRKQVEAIGCAMAGQSEEMAPADRRIYALRDVTATVESLPLITASILSKKLAEGISGLVLDVKVGSGAFMKTEARARELATMMLSTVRRMGKRGVVLITDMDQPMGSHIGNALEVKECLAVLRGEGAPDLAELATRLTGELLLLAGLSSDAPDGATRAEAVIRSGEALERFQRLVEEQGGDPRIVDDESLLPSAAHRVNVGAPRDGFVTEIDTEKVGTAGMLLGAGRQQVDDAIDPAAGIVVSAKLGTELRGGDPLVTLHYNDGAQWEEATRLIQNAYVIDDTPPQRKSLIRSVLREERTA